MSYSGICCQDSGLNLSYKSAGAFRTTRDRVTGWSKSGKRTGQAVAQGFARQGFALWEQPVVKHICRPVLVKRTRIVQWESSSNLAGWGFEQPLLVEGITANGRGPETRWCLSSLPTQTILWLVTGFIQPLISGYLAPECIWTDTDMTLFAACGQSSVCSWCCSWVSANGEMDL